MHIRARPDVRHVSDASTASVQPRTGQQAQEGVSRVAQRVHGRGLCSGQVCRQVLWHLHGEHHGEGWNYFF